LIKAYLFEGVELFSRGEYEAALDRCRRVLEIDPANEKARRYLDRIREEEIEVREIGEPHAP
jgi:lipoprotein NlpI